MSEGTHRRHTEGGVSDDSERVVKFLIEAHEPHGVEGIYVREAPAMEAARRPPPLSQGPQCAAIDREDALVDGSLAEWAQLIVRRGVCNIAIDGMQKSIAHGVGALCPDVSFSVFG